MEDARLMSTQPDPRSHSKPTANHVALEGKSDDQPYKIPCSCGGWYYDVTLEDIIERLPSGQYPSQSGNILPTREASWPTTTSPSKTSSND